MTFSGRWIVAVLWLPAVAGAEAMSDPGDWYRNNYAPLWAEQPARHVEDILGFYAPTVETHLAEGGVSQDARRDWLAEPMADWLAEGWVRAELAELKVDRLNAATASFKARWTDYYEGNASEDSCGWYLANWSNGQWQFTTYTDIDCKMHDLSQRPVAGSQQ